jgi:hypothetical protein
LNAVDKTRESHLILIGLSCTGKSSLAFELSVRQRVNVVEIGRIVNEDWLMCPNCVNPLMHADHTFASGAVTKFVCRAVSLQSNLSFPAIWVGPRRPEELEYLRSALLGPIAVIGITAPLYQRERRHSARETSTATQPYSLAFRDAVELAWGVGMTLSMSDFTIHNDGSLEQMAETILRVWGNQSEISPNTANTNAAEDHCGR